MIRAPGAAGSTTPEHSRDPFGPAHGGVKGSYHAESAPTAEGSIAGSNPADSLTILRQQIEELTRERDQFEDYMHGALEDYADAKRRAEAAEADLAAWRSRGLALVAQWRDFANRATPPAQSVWLTCADALAALLRAPQLTNAPNEKNDEDKNLARGGTTGDQ